MLHREYKRILIPLQKIKPDKENNHAHALFPQSTEPTSQAQLISTHNNCPRAMNQHAQIIQETLNQITKQKPTAQRKVHGEQNIGNQQIFDPQRMAKDVAQAEP